MVVCSKANKCVIDCYHKNPHYEGQDCKRKCGHFLDDPPSCIEEPLVICPNKKCHVDRKCPHKKPHKSDPSCNTQCEGKYSCQPVHTILKKFTIQPKDYPTEQIIIYAKNKSDALQQALNNLGWNIK